MLAQNEGLSRYSRRGRRLVRGYGHHGLWRDASRRVLTVQPTVTSSTLIQNLQYLLESSEFFAALSRPCGSARNTSVRTAGPQLRTS